MTVLPESVASTLAALRALPEGWDFARARRITNAAAVETERIVGVLLRDGMPPHLYPIPCGGIHIEWLVAGNSVIVEVDGNGEICVVAERADGTEVVGVELAAGAPLPEALIAFMDELAAMLVATLTTTLVE